MYWGHFFCQKEGTSIKEMIKHTRWPVRKFWRIVFGALDLTNAYSQTLSLYLHCPSSEN